ncbi:D-aminoacyl-tRNA deacylase [Nodularia spumigena]|uniref:D-aminoacyl-tRNA deacylase n=1 Tax=Nodularia spumigena TaxID=70799 RepID=UPI00396A80E6
MRAVVQRVERAEVRVHGDGGVVVAGAIGRGLVVLLGVEARDTGADAAWMASKIAGLRVFEDDGGRMNLGRGGGCCWCRTSRWRGRRRRGGGRTLATR